MKLCKDCKHFGTLGARCLAPQNAAPDYTGIGTQFVARFYSLAQYMRANEKYFGDTVCGPDAAWFEQVEATQPEAAHA